MTEKIYHPEDKHPDEWQKDLGPDASKGVNYHPVGPHPEKDNPRTAYDVKDLHRRMRDYTDDVLKQIPILPEGSRLEQDAVYIDLSQTSPREIRATGDMAVGPGQWVVPKSEVHYELWNRLIGVTEPARTGQGGRT